VIKETGRGRSPAKVVDLWRGGLLFTFTGIGFLLLITTLEAIYPGYSVRANTISDLLAIGAPTSLIGEPLALVIAVSWMAGGYHAYRDSGKAMRVLTVLPGTGLLIAVLSPENVNVGVHSVGAVLAFIPGGIMVILSYRTIRSPFRYFAAFLGALSLLGTIVEFGAYNTALMQQTLGPGGWERIIIYPVMIWSIGFGSYLLVVSRSDETRSESRAAPSRSEPYPASVRPVTTESGRMGHLNERATSQSANA
jgi:hypothetical membrane protein